jgi:hypothetical protein
MENDIACVFTQLSYMAFACVCRTLPHRQMIVLKGSLLSDGAVSCLHPPLNVRVLDKAQLDRNAREWGEGALHVISRVSE